MWPNIISALPKENISINTQLLSNIPAAPTNGVYISQSIRYFGACVQYSEFLDRAQLLTQKLIEQDYIAPGLKYIWPSTWTVDRYEISVSQTAMNLFYLLSTLFFPLSSTRVYRTWLWISWQVSYKNAGTVYHGLSLLSYFVWGLGSSPF